MLSSCDDGDLDTSSFEFEETVNVCGDYTLYRLSTISKREALVVTLTTDQIRKDEEPVAPVAVTQSGPYQVRQRLFDDTVGSDYFCAVVPPADPKVVTEWIGVSGSILVENRPIYEEDGTTLKAWEHVIVLDDVVLEKEDERLIFNDMYLFGTFTSSP